MDATVPTTRPQMLPVNPACIFRSKVDIVDVSTLRLDLRAGSSASDGAGFTGARSRTQPASDPLDSATKKGSPSYG